MPLLKLFFFGLILILMVFVAVTTYRWLNKKIIGSQKLTALVGFSVLLLIINAIILFGGIYLLLVLYPVLFAK